MVGGIAPAREAARDFALEVIPGVEFSTHLDGHEIHVLGLFIDDADAELVASTVQSRNFRRERAQDIIERLNGLGVEVTFGDVEAEACDGAMGRPHIAHALVRRGAVDNLDEAFRRYIGVGRPAFVRKPTLAVDEVIPVVHRAGGVAILAHPASSRVDDDEIRALAALGIDGFEVEHPKHGSSARRRLRALIEELRLLPSGGSDFHGPGAGPTKLGAHAVPVERMEALRAAARTYREAQA